MSNRLHDKINRIKYFVLGRARDIKDPHLFRHLSLVAFFAWVGLGADGLTSSCYGPEEAFLALQNHIFLGIFVAIGTALTIMIIAASYTQIVELFPGGGGGYLVASKLLSPQLGMISGCALLIDYVLTITLSIASGADAIFSFLPHNLIIYKLLFAICGLLALIALNLRGIKESVLPLVPIFLIFIITHAFAILYGFITHFMDFSALAQSTKADIVQTHSQLGMIGIFLLVMRSYSMGAGTYTGIEAVSNGMPILREPQVQTAKKTMFYMAVSLALMAFGLMVNYLFYRVQHVPGKTLNAVLMGSISAGWPSHIGGAFVLITLLSEGILLFVAAQTGFLDGPRVLANMSADRWFPSQFALLSERFVIKNGIIIMGFASLMLMIFSRGSVKFLIVLYSINVFITFCLSQAGMVRHWWKCRFDSAPWKRKLAINGIGLILTVFILIMITVIKFGEGGWITLIMTGSLIAVAASIKRYYYRTQRLLKRLDKLVYTVEEYQDKSLDGKQGEPHFNETSKTAIILVNGFNGMGLHTLFSVIRLFGDTFKNFIFMEAGMIDAGSFKGTDAIEALKEKITADLSRYENYMRKQGFFVTAYSAVGAHVIDEISAMAGNIYKKYPNCIFFGGQIVFNDESYLDKFLYNHVTFAVQKRLHQEGMPFMVMPVQVG